MSCILNIIGENLVIDTLVRETGLEPFKKTYKGQPKFKTKLEGEKIPYSFIGIEVSTSKDFNNQVSDCIEYLKQNEDKLLKLSAFKDIQYATLDLMIVHSQDVFVQSNYLPPDFIKLCGRFGLSIELSVYQDSE